MDPTAMDDKLYYVEGPESQVLGPMTMIHILEGIAAGAILEDARICGVGEQEWINLGDVAYTRDTPGNAAPQTAPADVSVLDEPAMTGGAPGSHDQNGADDPMDGAFDFDETFGAPRAEDTETNAEEDVADEAALQSMEQEAMDSMAALDQAGDEPVDAVPMDLPASAMPYETTTAGASDFALDMSDAPAAETAYSHDEPQAAEPEEWDTAAADASPSSGRPAWAIPVALAVGIPVVVGIYLLASGKLPLGNSEDSAPAVATSSPAAPAPAKTPVALAWDQLKSGDADGAMAAFQAIIKERPEAPGAHHGLALAHLEKGDAAAAFQHLTQARDLAPNNAEVRLDLARIMAADGRLEGATKEMAVYLDAHPDDLEAQGERLDWMMQAGQHAAAASIYADYAAVNESVARAQYLAGLAHPGSEDGVAYLRRAAQLAPGDPLIGKALDQAVASFAATSKPKPAQKVAATPPPTPKATSTAQPTTAPKKVADPAPVVAKTPEPTTSPLVETVNSIRAHLAAERFTDVRNEIDKGRQQMKGDATALANLGLWSAICDFHESNFEAALAGFEKLNPKASYSASGFGPGAVENWIARVHFSSGNARFAVGVLDQVGLESPDEYANARLWEGVALASLGMEELAVRTWNRVPADVGTRVTSAGLAAVKTAEFLTGSISEKQYRTALASDALWANDLNYFLGYSARRANNPELAREYFQRAMTESRGKDFPYHVARAEIAGEGLTGEW